MDLVKAGPTMLSPKSGRIMSQVGTTLIGGSLYGTPSALGHCTDNFKELVRKEFNTDIVYIPGGYASQV